MLYYYSITAQYPLALVPKTYAIWTIRDLHLQIADRLSTLHYSYFLDFFAIFCYNLLYDAGVVQVVERLFAKEVAWVQVPSPALAIHTMNIG